MAGRMQQTDLLLTVVGWETQQREASFLFPFSAAHLSASCGKSSREQAGSKEKPRGKEIQDPDGQGGGGCRGKRERDREKETHTTRPVKHTRMHALGLRVF